MIQINDVTDRKDKSDFHNKQFLFCSNRKFIKILFTKKKLQIFESINIIWNRSNEKKRFLKKTLMHKLDDKYWIPYYWIPTHNLKILVQILYRKSIVFLPNLSNEYF